jgi:3-dehydroquinate synthase
LIEIPPGEKSKKLAVIEDLSARLIELGIGRNGFLLAIGGGVVCDITGFLASVYMRGIRSGFISTSLLSQVDASIGGKNGVNIGNAKNMVGTFSQPEFVLCDPDMLQTLPADEYLSGLSEIIKTGAILDEELFTSIESNYDAIIKRDPGLLRELISRSVELKAFVVNEDEYETGLRRILNFGHTFGHVIETIAGQKHGFAVASGMVLAGNISGRLGLLNPSENERLRKLIERFGLLEVFNIPTGDFISMISRDKKKEEDEINFVLIERIGKAVVKKMKPTDLVQLAGSVNVL